MRKTLLPILPLLVSLGMTAPVCAQTSPSGDPDAPANTSKPGFFRLPGFGAKKTEAKPAADKNKTGTPNVENKQAELSRIVAQQELDLYHLRDKMCLHIIAIAQQTGNEKLERLANDLSQLAW